MRATVTGGGGFLGRYIVEQLLAEGHEVVSVSRGHYPELETLGVTCRQADLSRRDDALRSLAGTDVLFHVAALAGVWGPRADYHRANVEGTQNVLAACAEHGIDRLIHTSSPSVCFDGHDHLRASHDLPRAERFLAAYPRSKAQAEALVQSANGPTLATVILRPHLIVGPRDPHLVPRLLERASQGRLAIIGDGRNEVSLTHVGNAAHAHLCAARALHPGAPCAGQAYFVANAEPVILWDWINHLLKELGQPPITRRIPLGLANGLGALCEAAWTLLPLKGEPPMTRFVAQQLATSHSYDIAALRRDLGYEEQVSLGKATEEIIKSAQSAGQSAGR